MSAGAPGGPAGTGLARERTRLAWRRTALAAAVVAVRAVDHWARAERAMRLKRDLPVSRFPAVLAIAVGVGALLLVVAVIARGFG